MWTAGTRRWSWCGRHLHIKSSTSGKHWSSKHRCYKHRVHLSSCSCALSAQITLHLSSATAWSEILLSPLAQQSLISHCFSSLSPIFKPNWISMALLSQLPSLPGASRLVKMDERRRGLWRSQSLLLSIQITCFLLQRWWQYFLQGPQVFRQ